MSVAVAGLTKGTTYFYRVVATNLGGATISNTQSFTTLTEPVATLGAASVVTSQSARLNGIINAMGSPTSAVFEFGTDGTTFPNSIGATPSTVEGSAAVPVTATLRGLTQGRRYFYRLKGTSAGGVGITAAAPLVLETLLELTQEFPNAPPPSQGLVLVTLTPQGIGERWRFVGEQMWRESQVAASG